MILKKFHDFDLISVIFGMSLNEHTTLADCLLTLEPSCSPYGLLIYCNSNGIALMIFVPFLLLNLSFLINIFCVSNLLSQS